MAGLPAYGPTNTADLARRLTHLGEAIGTSSIGYWERAETLPHARYIAHLERMMGAPWSYLDDPKTPWPRPLDREALIDLADLLTLEELERLVEAFRQAVAKKHGHARERS